MAKVKTEHNGGTVVLTIDRREVQNCVDGETAQFLFEAVRSFPQAPDLDVLILTGAGAGHIEIPSTKPEKRPQGQL